MASSFLPVIQTRKFLYQTKTRFRQTRRNFATKFCLTVCKSILKGIYFFVNKNDKLPKACEYCYTNMAANALYIVLIHFWLYLFLSPYHKPYIVCTLF